VSVDELGMIEGDTFPSWKTKNSEE
jgi:hypothetical protein